jgi:hypothetical protein
VERQARQLVGRQVEDEHYRAGVESVDRAKQLAGHPQLFGGPADVHVREAELLGGDVCHLDEVPDCG